MPDSTSLENVPDPNRQEVIRRYLIMDTPRLAIEAANVGTWIIDEATRVFITSARVKELFGYESNEELTFDDALANMSDKDRNKVIAGIEETTNEGKPFHVDFSVTGYHDSKVRWIKAVGGLYLDPAEKLTHISGVMMDITEQKQNELRKNRFIGMVSHELKTPLTSLKAYVQILHTWARKQKDSFAIGTLAKIEKQVKKMGSIINGFLSLSQVESGKIHLVLQDFDLNEVINDAIEETLLLNPNNKISFAPAKPIIIHADQDKIDQVLINFLSNAIKYSPAGGLIEVSCQVSEHMVQVSVKDQGMGIAKEDIEKLFDRYYRVKSKQTKKIPGFGIGLYLSAEIISHHFGKIWVESEPGKGSTFFFKLPLKGYELPE